MNLINQGGALREPKDRKIRYDLIPLDMIKRLAIHYTTGGQKHGDRNRENGNMEYAELCKQSAFRHFYQRAEGLTDEDHASACIWNLMAYEHLLTKEEELDQRDNDLCNIHNSELSRSDMYMEIISYLVSKGFLQEGEQVVDKEGEIESLEKIGKYRGFI